MEFKMCIVLVRDLITSVEGITMESLNENASFEGKSMNELTSKVSTVGAYVLSRLHEYGDDGLVDMERLTYYLYYSWAWGLAWYKFRLFEEPVYAKREGICIFDLYGEACLGKSVLCIDEKTTFDNPGIYFDYDESNGVDTGEISLFNHDENSPIESAMVGVIESVLSTYAQMPTRIMKAYIVNEDPWSEAMWAAARESTNRIRLDFKPISAQTVSDFYSHTPLAPKPHWPGDYNINVKEIPTTLTMGGSNMGNETIKEWTPAWLDDTRITDLSFSERAAQEVRRSEKSNKTRNASKPVDPAEKTITDTDPETAACKDEDMKTEEQNRTRRPSISPYSTAGKILAQTAPELSLTDGIDAHINELAKLANLSAPISQKTQSVLKSVCSNVSGLKARAAVLNFDYDTDRFDKMIMKLYSWSRRTLIDDKNFSQYEGKLVEAAEAVSKAANEKLKSMNEQQADSFLSDMNSLLNEAHGASLASDIPSVQSDGLFSNDAASAGTIFDLNPDDDENPTPVAISIPDIGDIDPQNPMGVSPVDTDDLNITHDKDPNAKLTGDDIKYAAKETWENIKDKFRR